MSREIVVFLVGYDKTHYVLYIYNYNLVALNDGSLPEIDTISNFNEGYGIFSKAYHLTKRDAIFIYFTSPNSKSLKIKTGTISNDNKGFTTKIDRNINENNNNYIYYLNYNVLLNDFVKIDSNRFIYTGLLLSDSKTICVYLIDLYNSYSSMNIRIYKNTLNDVLDKEFSIEAFNDLFVFTSTATKNSNRYSILMIFGYANYTDNEIDISDYFMDDNENNPNNLFDKLLEGIQIENNIFNYNLLNTEIKLITIPEELLFYNKNTGQEVSVSNGDSLNKNFIFRQNQNMEKTDDYYYLDYQPIIEEPSYDNYYNGTDKYFEVNKQNEYQNNYHPKRYYGRTITIKFKLCHKYCQKCKKYGTSDDNQLCLSCLQNYRFFDDKKFNLNCVPEGYFYDYENNQLMQCTESNSKFYINLTDNSRICLKSSYPCPDEYPFYNETNKECINLTLPTTIITTIPKIPTTIPLIPTTIPIIPTTIPLIPTTIPSKLTTIPKIPTTIPLIPTTIPIIPTTMPLILTTLTLIPTTVISTVNKITTTFPEMTTIITTFLKTPTTIPEVPITIITTIPEIFTSLVKFPSTVPLKIQTTIITEKKIIPTTILMNEVIHSLTCSYNDLLNDKCFFKNMTNIDIYNKIKQEIMSSYPPNGESIVIHGNEDYVFHVTNNLNELSTLNGSIVNGYNLSIIDLAKCEDSIREANNINKDTPLNLLKFEKLTNISIEKNIQYEIFTLNSSKKLNLSVCKDTPVDIYIPIDLSKDTKFKYEDLKSQGYDLFDKNSSFYNDICTPYDSPNGTDVSLSTRNSEFYNATETSCQANCEYEDYSSEFSLLKCVCQVIEEDIDIDKPEKYTGMTFVKGFYDVLKNSNYEVVKCYKLVFRLINFINNIGCIIIAAAFLFYLIFMMIYICTGITKFKINISKIILNEQKKENTLEGDININNNINNIKNNNNNLVKKSNNNGNKPKLHFINKKIVSKKENIKKLNLNQNKTDINIINKNLLKPYNANKKNNQNDYKKNYPPNRKLKNKEVNKINKLRSIDFSLGKNSKDSRLNLNNNKSLLNNNLLLGTPKQSQKSKSILIKGINYNNSILNISKKGKKSIKTNKNNYKYSDFELNDMEYLEAVEYDKRAFCSIYWSILSREHLIIFTFFQKNDHNILSIKLSRFFFFVCTDIAMNVFFFTDESMHKIYKSYGKWDIFQNIPQILYSLLISQALQVFICFLTLTDKHYYQIKQFKFENNKKIIPIFNILKCVKIKLCLFYIFSLIFFLAYWYIVTAFCSVYKNTQIIFLKDSLMSFLGGIVYPFFLYIFPSILRIISIRAEKRNMSCLYKISDIIPIF